jgi:hypothetical protein
MRPASLQRMIALLEDWCRGVADGEDAASGWLKGSACSVVSRFMSLPPLPPPEPAYFPPYATRGGFSWFGPSTSTTPPPPPFGSGAWLRTVSWDFGTWSTGTLFDWFWWSFDNLCSLVVGEPQWEHIKYLLAVVGLVSLTCLFTWGLNAILGYPLRVVWWCMSTARYWMADPEDRLAMGLDECEWRGPGTNVVTDNDYYRDVIKARSPQTRTPNHLIVRDGRHYARMVKSQAAAKKVNRHGLLWQYGDIIECTHHELRDKIEATNGGWVCLCRSEPCGAGESYFHAKS